MDMTHDFTPAAEISDFSFLPKRLEADGHRQTAMRTGNNMLLSHSLERIHAVSFKPGRTQIGARAAEDLAVCFGKLSDIMVAALDTRDVKTDMSLTLAADAPAQAVIAEPHEAYGNNGRTTAAETLFPTRAAGQTVTQAPKSGALKL